MIFSAGCTNTNKKEAWEAVTRAVDAVSGEGRTIEEVKKKWFDLKCETKRNIAKFRRKMQRTGGGTPDTTPMSELDQRIGAIIRETALSGRLYGKNLNHYNEYHQLSLWTQTWAPMQCCHPLPVPLLLQRNLRLLLNGLKKEKPQGNDIRLPFTLTLLKKLITYLRGGCFGQYTDLLLETVFLTAFYGFLRGGEFTTRTGSFDPSHDLTIADVSINPHHLSLLLKHSKTDRDRKGSSVIISKSNSAFCLP